jgi:hypothetical protein
VSVKARLAACIVLQLVALSLVSTAHASTLGGGSCGPSWTGIKAPGVGHSSPDQTRLGAVDGSSSSDVWAVGSYLRLFPHIHHRLIAEHWDGSSWTMATMPDVPHAGGLLGLSGVAEITPTDVWAVGGGGTDGEAVVAHWGGSSWSLVSTPHLLGGRLNEVAALGADDIWAVGWQQNDKSGLGATLVEHYDGTAWTVVPSPSPDPSGFDELQGVTALGPDDVWAVGVTSATAGFKEFDTLIEHWDGTAWTVVPSPSPGSSDDILESVAGRDGDLWAAGRSDTQPMLQHWNGTAWTVVPSPHFGNFNIVLGIAYAAPGDVWFLGRHDVGGGSRVLGVHWDGTKVAKVTMPEFSTFSPDEVVGGATVLGDGTVWAVGGRSTPLGPSVPLTMRLCPVQVTDGGFAPDKGKVPMGATAAWTIPSSDTGVHSVTDPTGMHLFDSSTRSPGSSFLFTPPGAGRYRVLDSPTGETSQVVVQPIVQPGEGDDSTTFVLFWATAPPPDGFVFDVNLWIPHQGNWVNWLDDQTGTSALFTPDAGPGEYRFRVRLQRVSNAAHSDWSHPVSIEVS